MYVYKVGYKDYNIRIVCFLFEYNKIVAYVYN